MQGLKINISLTFILLLATGMLLINVIMTALWQHSLVNNQIENSSAILKIIASDPGEDFFRIKKSLETLLEQTNGHCAAIMKDGNWQTISTSMCGQEEKLRQVMHQTESSRDSATTCTGKTWGVFSSQKKYLYAAAPIINGRHVTGAVGMVYPLQSIWQTIRQDQKIILVYILVNTIILTVIGFFRVASLVIRPIDRLVQETTSYSGKSNLGFVSDMEGSEFRQLSSAINRMVERIDADRINLQETVTSLKRANEKIRTTQQDMIRAEKLASVGRLSAGLAHEIGNPLGVVLGYLGLLRQKKLSDEERAEYIERSEQELNRINLLVRQLLDFSRPLPATADRVHIHVVLSDILHMLQTQKEYTTITFDNLLRAENDVVRCNEEALRQAFMNFYLNSLDAIQETENPEQGSIMTESNDVLDEAGKSSLQVIITDNGSGISPEHVTNIFDPFFTTKDPGKGTGLGLSVSYTIIENTGGTVRVASNKGQGTTMIIELPVC